MLFSLYYGRRWKPGNVNHVHSKVQFGTRECACQEKCVAVGAMMNEAHGTTKLGPGNKSL